MKTQPERLVYSLQETATVLGMSLSTVKRLILADKLPHVRAGKRVLVPRAALEDFLKTGTSRAA